MNRQFELSLLPPQFLAAIGKASALLGATGRVWLIGGSTGLLLQGVQLAAPPRDLDIYADREDVYALHAALAGYAVDEQQESATPIYKSILSHYAIGDVKVELVGAFEVNALGSEYKVEARYFAEALAGRLPDALQPAAATLMPLAHELVFNLLRGRPDRYEAIGAVCRLQPDVHAEALEAIGRRSRLSPALLTQARRLIGAANRSEHVSKE